jgi:O-Antigen ligase
MSVIALTPLHRLQERLLRVAAFGWKGVALALGALAAYGALIGVSANFLFFALTATGFALALSSSLRNATFYSMAFLCVKPALWRLAYHLDYLHSTPPQVDLFRFSAGLYLAALCVIVISKRLIENRRSLRHKLDLTIAIFIGVYAVSIFNPHNSPIAGLAGFERNIFPTVAVFFLAGEVMRSKDDLIAFVKVIAVTALVTTLYGLKHTFSGIWGFETTAFDDLFAREGFDGWLTIGIKGIEFRTFSTFFGYMEFTFTLALWGIILIGDKFQRLSKRWRALRWVTAFAMIALLSLSLERTPILMIIAGLMTAWYIRSSKKQRSRIALTSAIVVFSIVTGLALFERQLEETGVAKLERIAELGDPSKATSIQDRVDRMWKPTLRIIAANPLGVGAGYGSQTAATAKSSGSGYLTQPHNELMQKALEAGWLGAALFGFIIVMMFRELKRLSETSVDTHLKRLTALGCGIVVAFALCAQINLPFSGAQGIFFWFVTGSLISVARIHQESAAAGNSDSHDNTPLTTANDSPGAPR